MCGKQDPLNNFICASITFFITMVKVWGVGCMGGYWNHVYLARSPQPGMLEGGVGTDKLCLDFLYPRNKRSVY